MIELKGLSKTYGKNGKKAVDELTLSVGNGVLFGFIGPNGAGKTTTIKMMTGIISPDQGDVMVDGQDLKARPLEVKKRIGYVADNSPLPERLKAIEYLQFLADM